MQHHYISNLQKANLFLKSRIKELEELVDLYKSQAVNNTLTSKIIQIEKELAQNLALKPPK
jgi:hypothetical protein